MGSNDEPSNPFKSPRKSTSTAKNTPQKSGRRSQSRSHSGPPAPPGAARKTPPAAPSGNESKVTKSNNSEVRSPARAGKSVGLRKQKDSGKTDAQKKTDERARELIEASRAKVSAQPSERQTTTKSTAKKEPDNPFKKNQSQRPKGGGQQRRGGRQGKRNKPQGPTKRVQKLHRGKYMEFKYDVRRILDEENVEDEHRSNVLGQTWAKGERQGVSDAKDFLQGKVDDGIISEECSKRIIKLIDSLTTRR
ncbi:MAG: hypothetical protein VX473_00900 [Candidatus Thermoplasmatota archaeon]|nr:hypothetical protein [Candidatus Thermoplasmatota archaeon]